MEKYRVISSSQTVRFPEGHHHIYTEQSNGLSMTGGPPPTARTGGKGHRQIIVGNPHTKVYIYIYITHSLYGNII